MEDVELSRMRRRRENGCLWSGLVNIVRCMTVGWQEEVYDDVVQGGRKFGSVQAVSLPDTLQDSYQAQYHLHFSPLLSSAVIGLLDYFFHTFFANNQS